VLPPSKRPIRFSFLGIRVTGNIRKNLVHSKIHRHLDIFRMWATWDKYPYKIIPGKGFGDDGPDFVVPYIFIRSEESIHFEN
ncbi:MAG: hypothetical protein IIU04_01800, partial [Bacteroidales bacterium]|nr:hypothetical protein [Bacteroidales bacterium]